MRLTKLAITVLIVAVLSSSCSEVKTPSRNEIPIIKEKVTKLQDGVIDRNLAAIDSVLSVDILKKKKSSDSLLKFIYGPNYDFAFESFGQAEIVYTDNFARVESSLKYQNDSTEHPLTFTFSNESGQWLLVDFKQGHSDSSE